jgi:hypothetical protein
MAAALGAVAAAACSCTGTQPSSKREIFNARSTTERIPIFDSALMTHHATSRSAAPRYRGLPCSYLYSVYFCSFSPSLLIDYNLFLWYMQYANMPLYGSALAASAFGPRGDRIAGPSGAALARYSHGAAAGSWSTCSGSPRRAPRPVGRRSAPVSRCIRSENFLKRPTKFSNVALTCVLI